MSCENWCETNGLVWRKLEPFGVEVNTDLSQPLSSRAEKQLLELFWDNGLLLARNQNLSMSRQREIVSVIGLILIREGESGYLSNDGAHDVACSALAFHADAAYTTHPFDAIALHAVDVVDDASATWFAHAERAFEQLPEELKSMLATNELRMITPGYDILDQRVCDLDDPAFMLESSRPAIVRNPNTGRDYVNLSEMHAAEILRMPKQHGRDLIHRVFDVLYAPDNLFEHRWKKGDLLVWDNQALQHARPSIKDAGTRVLQRVIVGSEGDAPHVEKEKKQKQARQQL